MTFAEYTLPAHWSSALINADTSGMTDEEESELDSWLESEKPGYCVSCSEDPFFTWRNDANNLGADCLIFTFQKVTE